MTDKTSLFEMPLHPYSEALLAAVPIPKASARQPQAGDPQGRCAEPDQPARRLPFPYALPLRDLALPRRGAAAARGGAGALRGLPPARRRGQISAGDNRGAA
jgi:hypothetical protein